MNLYQSVKKIRKYKKVTQGELAQAVGITQTYLSQLENGEKTNAHSELIEKICTYLKVPYVIIVWFSIDESQISKEKKEAYSIVKPTLDNLILQVFDLETETELIKRITTTAMCKVAEQGNLNNKK